MTGLLKCRRYPTRGSLYFLLFILASTAATTMPVSARANDAAIDAIINHPAVAAAQAEARLDALKEKVALTAVRAPVDGIITAVHVNTVGGVVDGGTVMAEMVPIEGEVTVRARVNTDDVSKINVGQDVRISLTAYDVSRYGTLTGKVQKIANNSTQEENLPPYFVTLIKIPDPQFEQSGFAPEVVPGMTVIVDVLGGKRTVINYILSPIERAQSIAFREK